MKYAVVGAGVLGMSLARRLAGGAEVVLFEGADQLGGLAAPWSLGDVTWDRHYHVTLLSDERTREMYAAIGIGRDELCWVETSTGYFGPDEVLRSVSTPVELLRLPGLGLLDKARIGANLLYGSRIRRGERMERLTTEDWLRRWSGSAGFEAFWLPLLRAKLGDAHGQASAAFIWATMRRLDAARRNGMSKRFGYVRGGYARVCEAFGSALGEVGVDVRLSSRIGSITAAGDGLDVRIVGGEPERFDRVVVTTSSTVAARMCPDLLPGERRRLESVRYVGIVCTSLLLRRPLSGHYLTYITDPVTPFTAVVEMTALIDPAEVGGHTLVYLPKYTSVDHPWFSMGDDAVVGELMPYLRKIHPDLSDADVVAARVSRVPQVFAVPSLRYSERMPSISTSVPGLYLAGSAHLPFATLNVNDTLSLVDRVLDEARVGVEPGAFR